MSKREHPMPGQVLMQVANLGDYENEVRRPVETPEQADVITSLTTEGRHRPVLDIDIPAKLIPSSTPGHSHLYIDREMSWEDYVRLLTVLADVGIIERGYATVSIYREHTAVRLPWVRKPGPSTTGLGARGYVPS